MRASRLAVLMLGLAACTGAGSDSDSSTSSTGSTTSATATGSTSAGGTSSSSTASSSSSASSAGTTGASSTGGAASTSSTSTGSTGSTGCVPSCAGRACGDDGCGGSCGGCPGGAACDSAGFCTGYSFQSGDPTPTGITSIDQWSCTPAPARPTLGEVSVAIDGDLSDWPTSARIIVDDPGDVRTGNLAFDLREIYAGYDSTGTRFRLGVRLGAAPDPGVIYQVYVRALPAYPDTTDADPLDSVQVVGSQVNRYHDGPDGSSYAAMPDAQLALGSEGFEVEVPADQVANLAGSAFRIEGRTFDGAISNPPTVDLTGLFVQGTAAHGCRVQLGRGPVDVWVHEPPEGGADFAQTALYAHTVYLPLTEALNGEPWPYPTLDVFGTAGMTYDPAGAKGFNYQNLIGAFVWGTVPHNQLYMYLGQVVHEVSHSYNGTMQGAWLREGHSNWQVSRAYRQLVGPQAERGYLREWLGGYVRPWSGADELLSTWGAANLSSPDWSFLYGKALLEHWSLASQFGVGAVQQAALRSHQLGGLDSAGFQDQLAQAVGAPVDAAFAGWVYPGSYDHDWHGSDWDDVDHDGLLGLEEQVLGTDPTQPDSDGDGLADGYETFHPPLSPLQAMSDGLTPDLQAAGGLAVDGLSADWQAQSGAAEVTGSTLTGPSASCPASTELTRMRLERRGDVLWGELETSAPPIPFFAQGGYQLDIDLDGNGSGDAVIASRCDDWVPLAYEPATGAFDAPWASCAVGQVVEFSLPLTHYSTPVAPLGTALNVTGESFTFDSAGQQTFCWRTGSAVVP